MPSAWQAAALALLGLLAGLSVLASAMPRVPAVLLAATAGLYGLRLGWLELLAYPAGLSVPHDGAATVDGEPVRDLRVDWRGPAAFVRWRDGAGRWQRWVATPDVLDASARRALRLAGATARSRRSVAP